jgi:hypothetical protein
MKATKNVNLYDNDGLFSVFGYSLKRIFVKHYFTKSLSLGSRNSVIPYEGFHPWHGIQQDLNGHKPLPYSLSSLLTQSSLPLPLLFASKQKTADGMEDRVIVFLHIRPFHSPGFSVRL